VLPRAQVDIFGEGVARGGFGASLSQLLGAVSARVRELAGGGAWQIISRGPLEPVVGVVQVVESLAAVQHLTYTTPTILVTASIGGWRQQRRHT
jgi:hypothetical protein